MARTGQFLGPTQVFGAPLAIVHPPDNNVVKSRYHPSLIAGDYTEEQMRDMQDEINALLAVLQIIGNLPA